VGDELAADLLSRFAPFDVTAAIVWLIENGYALTSQRGTSTFGAQWVYSADRDVVVTVDRAQWMLDVSANVGEAPWQYDLLLVAHAGQPYADVFPTVGARSLSDPLPDQLPEGVSWRDTLPVVLGWLERTDVRDVGAAVVAARQQRLDRMWQR